MAAAGLALAALLLLPGLLVARAPWAAVPFLSLFFWIASWWWLPSLGRVRFLGAALAAFAVGGVLRLLRPDPSRPSWPALVVVAAALLHAAAGLGARVDPAPAQLMVWHDGLPKTYAPLRQGASFGADPHGLDALAADLAQLSGLALPRALALAAAAAAGLSSIGLYVLLARRPASAPAALATLAASAVAGLLEAFGAGMAPASLLALGFVLSAAGLLARARSRSAAVAAGALLATATLTAPAVVAAGLAAAAVAVAVAWPRLSAEERAALPRRLGLAGGVAAMSASPFLVRVGMSLAR